MLTENYKIDTSKIGNITITFQVESFFKKKYNYETLLHIVDTEKPSILYNKEIITEVGQNIDLLKDVSVSDNSNEDIMVSIRGEYDINKVGVYNLEYVAKDSSGNETTESFSLVVKEKKIVEKPTHTTSEIVQKEDQIFITSKGFQGIIKNGVTYIDGILIVNKTYALPSTYGNGLENHVLIQFNEMKSAATLEGLNIYLSSGYRSYATQSKLYNNYVLRDGVEKADTYSARAGHSEHQSGLAFDVNQINDTFHDSAEAKWLSNNCYKYGFILRYPKGKTNETGYKYESWHFRYVGVDLATKLYNGGDWITLEDYFGITSQYS